MENPWGDRLPMEKPIELKGSSIVVVPFQMMQD